MWAASTMWTSATPEWAGKEQQVTNLWVDYGQKVSWFEPELLQIPRETVLGWVAQHKELAPYRKHYEDMYALAAHTLSGPEEQILALSGNITGTTADVYSKMTDADLQFGWIKDEKGDSVKTDYSGWVSYRTSKDRRLREDYFKGGVERVQYLRDHAGGADGGQYQEGHLPDAGAEIPDHAGARAGAEFHSHGGLRKPGEDDARQHRAAAQVRRDPQAAFGRRPLPPLGLLRQPDGRRRGSATTGTRAWRWWRTRWRR